MHDRIERIMASFSLSFIVYSALFKAFISDERLSSQKLYSVLNSLAAQCIINRGGGLFTVNLLQVCEVDKLEFLRAGVRWNEEFWPGFTTDPKVIFQR